MSDTTEGLVGKSLPSEAFPSLRHVKNLYYYDGPLLDLMLDNNNMPVLRSWIDCDEVKNVWAFVWLTAEDLKLYVRQTMSLAEVFRSSTRILVCESRNSDGMLELREVTPEVLMRSHAPSEDSYLSFGVKEQNKLLQKVRQNTVLNNSTGLSLG